MSDIEELRARAEEMGVKVDGRWGFTKLCQVISDAEAAGDGFGSTADYEAAYDPDEDRVSRDFGGDSITDEDIAHIADVAAAEVVAELQPPAPVGDVVWPKRIAPCAWLDQSGRRHTDLGSARAAVDALRGQS